MLQAVAITTCVRKCERKCDCTATLPGMTQPAVTIDELLSEWGEALRAAVPQWTPEELEQAVQSSRRRLAADLCDRLDAANAVACSICLTERPRKSPDEPYYFPADQCPKAVRVWHYHRVWDRETDQETARNHALALARRRGRLPAMLAAKQPEEVDPS